MPSRSTKLVAVSLYFMWFPTRELAQEVLNYLKTNRVRIEYYPDSDISDSGLDRFTFSNLYWEYGVDCPIAKLPLKYKKYESKRHWESYKRATSTPASVA